MNFCTVDGCGRPRHTRLHCRTHHRWSREGRAFDKPPQVKKHEGACASEGCEKDAKLLGFCANHYRVFKRNGHANTRVSKLQAITKAGYRTLYATHPDNHLGYREYEHRVVMSKIIGRPLRKDENVHHKNGDRLDNRPENLELWSSWQPYGQRVEDKVAWAKELLGLYEPDALKAQCAIMIGEVVINGRSF